jgi:hypothetical protein
MNDPLDKLAKILVIFDGSIWLRKNHGRELDCICLPLKSLPYVPMLVLGILNNIAVGAVNAIPQLDKQNPGSGGSGYSGTLRPSPTIRYEKKPLKCRPTPSVWR